MSPLVSILVTVYKRTEFLSSAIESALKQTFSDYEIIVADDSGSSMAEDICRPYAQAGRLRYQANPQTLGIAVSLRKAMESATGKYIAILNDDDIWEPEFLAFLLPPLEADSRLVLAFSDHWIMPEDGSIDAAATDANSLLYGRSCLPGGRISDTAKLVVVQNAIPLAMAAVFRKEAFDSALLTPAVAGAYDFWISSALAATGAPFYYVPKRLTRYRVHARMETGRRSPDKLECDVYIAAQFLKRGWFPELRSQLRARLGGALFRTGRDRLYFNETKRARRDFLQSFLTRPDWRPVVVGLLSVLPQPCRRRLGLSSDLTPKQ
jgi:glycosyltransferase involved in cell wall biosynthesis